MNAPDGARSAWNRAWPALLALLLSLVAINSQSFWIDETDVATIASGATLSDWWQHLVSYGSGDTQMPGYMFYAWVWEKLFGHSEIGLRAANVPWLVLGFLALPRRQGYYVASLALSPFLWYYLNEARPYLMEIGASLIMLGISGGYGNFPPRRRRMAGVKPGSRAASVLD